MLRNLSKKTIIISLIIMMIMAFMPLYRVQGASSVEGDGVTLAIEEYGDNTFIARLTVSGMDTGMSGFKAIMELPDFVTNASISVISPDTWGVADSNLVSGEKFSFTAEVNDLKDNTDCILESGSIYVDILFEVSEKGTSQICLTECDKTDYNGNTEFVRSSDLVVDVKWDSEPYIIPYSEYGTFIDYGATANNDLLFVYRNHWKNQDRKLYYRSYWRLLRFK